MQLVIANKLYSSWSLRPWMLMTALGVPFEETVIPMYLPDSKARMLDVSPTGKMPLLIDGDLRIWESLAIVEYLHERFPAKGVWPSEAARRAHARSIASEMHAGFQGLRNACPMNLGKRFHPRDDLGSDVADNVRRFEGLVSDARRRFGAGGEFLYGAFCAADAMYAPLCTRLDTYQVPLAPQTRAYVDAVLAHPAFRAWRDAALTEPWSITHYEAGWNVAESFHQPSILSGHPIQGPR
ncbi:MAG: glutathione S-transferase family protein [Hyphomicrobiaceae bacterium]|nr:glutathione S-transferase family protein [Hyphomicrobiaceae bacterium]